MKKVEIRFYESDAHCGDDYSFNITILLENSDFESLIESAKKLHSWYLYTKGEKWDEHSGNPEFLNFSKILDIKGREGSPDWRSYPEIEPPYDGTVEVTMEDEWYARLALPFGEKYEICDPCFSGRFIDWED